MIALRKEVGREIKPSLNGDETEHIYMHLLQHSYTYSAYIRRKRVIRTNRPVQRLDRPDATVIFSFVFEKSRRVTSWMEVLQKCGDSSWDARV